MFLKKSNLTILAYLFNMSIKLNATNKKATPILKVESVSPYVKLDFQREANLFSNSFFQSFLPLIDIKLVMLLMNTLCSTWSELNVSL